MFGYCVDFTQVICTIINDFPHWDNFFFLSLFLVFFFGWGIGGGVGGLERKEEKKNRELWMGVGKYGLGCYWKAFYIPTKCGRSAC